jgi:hypothetical protein
MQLHTVALGKVSTLNHEPLDDTVEDGAFIAISLLACGQSPDGL